MAAFRSTRPFNWGAEVQHWVLDAAPQLRQLRASLHHTLTGSAVPQHILDDLAERMVLVATELATNAIRYGRHPVTIRLYRTGTYAVLEVIDHDTQLLPADIAIDARQPEAGGLGLRISRELATDLGWYVTGTTKHVWAQFVTPTPASRP